MQRLNIYFLLITIVFFHSCELIDKIDYKSYYKGDKFVINGFISVDEGLVVIIKKTVEPNKIESNDIVYNVIAELYEDGMKIDELKRTDDYHFTASKDIKFDLNRSYYIKAKSPKIQDAVSNPVYIVGPPNIKSITFTEDEGYMNMLVTLQNNNPGNSYLVKIYRYNNDIPLDNIEDVKFSPFDLKYGFGYENAVIDYRVGYSSQFDSLKIDVYSFSDEFRKFSISYNDYDLTRGDMFFEQPYPVYSSIEAGYGFFASYNKTSFQKKLEK